NSTTGYHLRWPKKNSTHCPGWVDHYTVFRQDGTIEVPDDPVRPRKGIVLILSMLAGGFLGVAVALAILMVRGGFRRTVDAA
ncbi:hypothetical protein OLM66_16260, partial [Pseudomonas aeruginosa]|nr:hypothetical protein [Pseudomonas aeruginosa]